jgi:hypothetical protein
MKIKDPKKNVEYLTKDKTDMMSLADSILKKEEHSCKEREKAEKSFPENAGDESKARRGRETLHRIAEKEECKDSFKKM